MSRRHVVDLTSTWWRSYLTALEKRPLRTTALTTGVLMGSGDLIAQLLLERRQFIPPRWKQWRPSSSMTNNGHMELTQSLTGVQSFDYLRTGRFLAVGLCAAGPAMFVWYRYLDRLVRGTGMSVAIRKTAADQLGFLPIYLGSFVGLIAALRGDAPADIARLLRRDMGPMLAASYVVWPVVQIVNFRFVPLRHRVLLINVVCLFWNTYISWRAEQQLNGDEPATPEVCDAVESRDDVLLIDNVEEDDVDCLSFFDNPHTTALCDL
jgi:protein Mpv17